MARTREELITNILDEAAMGDRHAIDYLKDVLNHHLANEYEFEKAWDKFFREGE